MKMPLCLLPPPTRHNTGKGLWAVFGSLLVHCTLVAFVLLFAGPFALWSESGVNLSGLSIGLHSLPPAALTTLPENPGAQATDGPQTAPEQETFVPEYEPPQAVPVVQKHVPPKKRPKSSQNTALPQSGKASAGASSPTESPSSGNQQAQGGQGLDDAENAQNATEVSFGTAQGPFFTKLVKANYPLAAKRRGLEGSVNLRLYLDSEGQVHSVHIANSTDALFNEAAIAVIRRSSFAPYTHNGRGKACWTTVSIEFSLRES